MKNQLNNDILLLENIWMDKMQSHSFPEYNSDTDEIDDAYGVRIMMIMMQTGLMITTNMAK